MRPLAVPGCLTHLLAQLLAFIRIQTAQLRPIRLTPRIASARLALLAAQFFAQGLPPLTHLGTRPLTPPVFTGRLRQRRQSHAQATQEHTDSRNDFHGITTSARNSNRGTLPLSAARGDGARPDAAKL